MSKLSQEEFNRIVKFALANYDATDGDFKSKAQQYYDNAYKAAYMTHRVKDGVKTSQREAQKAGSEAFIGAAEGITSIKDFKPAFIERINQDFTTKYKYEESPTELVELKAQENDPVFLAINEIDQRIKELQPWWNIFQLNAKEIKCLTDLKTKLLLKNKRKIGEEIDEWSENEFTKQVIVKGSSAEQFISRLKEKHGDQEMKTKIDRIRKLNHYQPFVNYLSDRKSWFQRLITFFFRDSALSQKKIDFAEKVVNEIQNFKGSYRQLDMLLKEEHKAHTDLSRSHQKKHFNLVEEREDKTERPESASNEVYSSLLKGTHGLLQYFPSITLKNDVRKDEDENRSALADSFHSSFNPK